MILLSNKGSETSESANNINKKKDSFLSYIFEHDKIWITILAVYFIIFIIICLVVAYHLWKNTIEPFHPYSLTEVKYEPRSSTGNNMGNNNSNTTTNNTTTPLSSKTNTTTNNTTTNNTTTPLSSKTNTTQTITKPTENIQTTTDNLPENIGSQNQSLSFNSPMLVVRNLTETVGFNITTTIIEQNATTTKITTITVQSSAPREMRLVVLSITFGALGAAIHGITSLTDWVSRKKAHKSYFLWWLSRPFIGAALAVIVYLMLRATLLSTVPGFNAVPYINDFGVAAISALIGLMNIQMVTKLRDVFDQLFGIRKTDQDKGDEPSVAEENIKLSIESPEIEEGKDSFLIGVVKDDEGNPKKDLEVNFAIANTTYASFKENDDPRKITDSNGVAVQRFQALKKGNTLAVITAKDKDKELYANVPISVKAAPPPDSDASGESSGLVLRSSGVSDESSGLVLRSSGVSDESSGLVLRSKDFKP